MATKLLDLESPAEFQREAHKFMQRFPGIRPWLNWWVQDGPAQMLFKASRIMHDELWDSLPSTTNAEECMHWRLYCAVGRDNSFFDSLHGLHRFVTALEQRTDARLGISLMLYLLNVETNHNSLIQLALKYDTAKANHGRRMSRSMDVPKSLVYLLIVPRTMDALPTLPSNLYRL